MLDPVAKRTILASSVRTPPSGSNHFDNPAGLKMRVPLNQLDAMTCKVSPDSLNGKIGNVGLPRHKQAQEVRWGLPQKSAPIHETKDRWVQGKSWAWCPSPLR